MRILASFPGRYGDILWSLPSIRAIAETYDTAVDLVIAGEFGSILPLLKRCAPYLGNVWASPTWGLTPPNEWNPPIAPQILAYYDRVYHLGYKGWPDQPLAQSIYTQLDHSQSERLVELDLDRPWLNPPVSSLDFFQQAEVRIAVGFSECWFELKYGLLKLFEEHNYEWRLECCMNGGRWGEEAGKGLCSWVEAATCISQAQMFVGCCSALHVLARALGKPVVLIEPMKERHNPIFYPYGTSGHGVELVLGGDGLPTFDARHSIETIERVLSTVRTSTGTPCG